MKAFLLIIFIIPIIGFGQITLHGANISITGSFQVNNNINGHGKIKISNRGYFKAKKISCNIEVSETKGSFTEYFKDCSDGDLVFNLFDMTGKYLMSGVFNEVAYVNFPKDTPLLLILSDNTVKKLFIKS